MTSFTDRLVQFGAGLALERPARKQGLAELAERLRSSGALICDRLENLPDTEQNCRLLSHVIGIERWGGSRLQTALGAPLTLDEYDGYRPPPQSDWEALQIDFAAARLTTLELARQLEKAGLPEDLKIRHNQFGGLSVRAWLRYLQMHADGEVRKMR